MDNIKIYKSLLKQIMDNGAGSPGDDIAGEILGAVVVFDPEGPDIPTNEAYVRAEMDWYKSQDRCITGHIGIESNKIWKKIASPTTNCVNSNYGWCIFSAENYLQYQMAVDAFKENRFTKRATMIYSRPSIVFEWNDGIHASHDAICTIYCQAELRMYRDEYVLDYHVHMRSNDAWYGMRNDYKWHKYVIEMLRETLTRELNVPIKLGVIRWFADSLHIYKFALPMITNFLNGESDEHSRL